jgi:uncharacterized protein YegL
VNAPLGKLLPFYLVIDVSFSMQGNKIEAVNEMMPAVLDALAQAPILSDKVRFALIDFSKDAQVRLPLSDLLDEHTTMPELTTRTITSYAAAFRLLRTEIEQNVRQLKADGYAVHRPAVFFLSDGAPTDTTAEWQAAFRELTSYDPKTGQGFAMFPNVVPCGVGDADPKTLQALIHPAEGSKQMRMYLMDHGEDAAKAISTIAEVLISSVLASGESLAKGESGLILPDEKDLPAGVSSFTADHEDFV